MTTRRQFIQSASALASGGALDAACARTMTKNRNVWFMPDESEPHKRTWMAFGASKQVWGGTLLPEVQRNLATIALTIANYEPVSMLVREGDFAAARKLVGSAIELITCPLDDLWIRDSGPTFVITEAGEKAGIDFNFKGWGEKQNYDLDTKVARFVTEKAGVKRIRSNLVLEGGGIEVDGRGTATITESCVLNSNRNPGISKSACEAELKQLLGLEKIIWLPGIKDKDITDGHTDFYARFARPGVVVAAYDADPKSFDHALTKRHLEILKDATDANGQKLQVTAIEGPSNVRNRYTNDDFAAGYINFYVANGVVIAPQFGDAKADQSAKAKLKSLFPDRHVVQINIDGIAAGGGGIHCATQQEPAA